MAAEGPQTHTWPLAVAQSWITTKLQVTAQVRQPLGHESTRADLVLSLYHYYRN